MARLHYLLNRYIKLYTFLLENSLFIVEYLYGKYRTVQTIYENSKRY